MRDFKPVHIDTLLACTPLFAELPEGELQALARDAREFRVPKGQTILRLGQRASGLHVLVDGQVKLALTSPQGNEKIVEIAQVGDYFGEASLFDDTPSSVYAEALSDARVLVIAKSALDQLLHQDMAFVDKLIASLARRLHRMLYDVEVYSLYSGRQRVIAYLLRELPAGEDGAGCSRVELGVAKGVIASRLNLTQEHFSRILHDLAQLGMIEVDRRQITIPCVDRLRDQLMAA